MLITPAVALMVLLQRWLTFCEWLECVHVDLAAKYHYKELLAHIFHRGCQR